jgi:peptidoglycan/LPS O-acetylase OafA/YrhL
VFAQRWPVAYASGAILLAMAATGAVAAVSFRVIEQPALRLKRLFVA